MKQKLRSILIPLLISTSANVGAEIVQATGYGGNFSEALHQSKLEALQQVVGTFMIGNREIKDDKVFEEILEYHGGYIKSYDVLEYNETTHSVTISADVEVNKDNSMQFVGDEFAINQDIIEDFENKQEIINKLDDPTQAFAGKILNVKINPLKHGYRYDIKGVVTWHSKWVSDLETFLVHATEDGRTKSNMNIRIATTNENVVSSLFSMVGDALVNQQPQQSNNSMVCFAVKKGYDVDLCKEVVGGFENMPIFSDMTINIVGYDKSGNKVHIINTQLNTESLYDHVYKGETKTYFLKKRTFNQPGLIIHKNGMQFLNKSFVIEKDIAKNITKFKLEIGT